MKVVDGPESGNGLVERYQKTASSKILKEICRTVVDVPVDCIAGRRFSSNEMCSSEVPKSVFTQLLHAKREL